MHMHGIVMSATLAENPPGSDIIEMTLRVQGVGAGQPRQVVIPYELLLRESGLDPAEITGHAFQAEVFADSAERWVVAEIAFGQNRVLREDRNA
jgi:hypothetical protein